MKPAFTLAEVLVTLGVIGVVAAMTLPMLARNYQFYIRQQQFKKAYAALNIAVQKAQIDMGEGVRCYYPNGKYDLSKWSDCGLFYQTLVDNLIIIKSCIGNARKELCLPNKGWRGGEVVYAETQGGADKVAAKNKFMNSCGSFSADNLDFNTRVYLTKSGFSILPYKASATVAAPIFALDINSQGGPNKWGYDIFVFQFIKHNSKDSIFKLEPTTTCHPLESGGYYTTTFMEYLYGRSAEL